MPPPRLGAKCHPCVRNTVLPVSQEEHSKTFENSFGRGRRQLRSLRVLQHYAGGAFNNDTAPCADVAASSARRTISLTTALVYATSVRLVSLDSTFARDPLKPTRKSATASSTS